MDPTTDNSTKDAYSRPAWISARKFELLCLVLLLSGMPRSARAHSTADEYQVKAALLFHFAQFLNWPADSLKAGDPSVSLCIFDDEPRRKELQSTVVGKLIGARDANHALVVLAKDRLELGFVPAGRHAHKLLHFYNNGRGRIVTSAGRKKSLVEERGMDGPMLAAAVRTSRGHRLAQTIHFPVL
jgi:hypothetical protein